MESIPYIKNNGVIIIEDTHTSFMNYKGFKNPSKYSFINFSLNLIENIHQVFYQVQMEINTYGVYRELVVLCN